MSSSTRRTVVVVGATGQQGGSVINSLLSSKHNHYNLVGLTRHPTSESSKSLESKGVKVIEGDLGDKASLVKAFQSVDAWAVFGVTNAMDPSVIMEGKPEVEQEEGKNLVDAVLEAKVEYFIWSTLPDSNKVSGNKFNVPHFYHKAAVADYASSKLQLRPGGSGTKYIGLMVPFFYENFLASPPRPSEDGKSFVLSQPCLPKTRLVAFSARDDIGAYTEWILSTPDRFVGKTIVASCEELDWEEFAATFSKVFGKEVKYGTLPGEVFSSMMPKPIADELLQMFRYFDEFGYGAKLSQDAEVRSKASKFEDWLRKNKDNEKFAALNRQ